jgi:hypothetical protein
MERGGWAGYVSDLLRTYSIYVGGADVRSCPVLCRFRDPIVLPRLIKSKPREDIRNNEMWQRSHRSALTWTRSCLTLSLPPSSMRHSNAVALITLWIFGMALFPME